MPHPITSIAVVAFAFLALPPEVRAVEHAVSKATALVPEIEAREEPVDPLKYKMACPDYKMYAMYPQYVNPPGG